jgi:hypothetical protein
MDQKGAPGIVVTIAREYSFNDVIKQLVRERKKSYLHTEKLQTRDLDPPE